MCVYCHQIIGDREPLDNPAVTHGACEPCLKKALDEWAAPGGESIPLSETDESGP
jgi:hypothetical protein